MNIQKSIPDPKSNTQASTSPMTLADLLAFLETAPDLNAKRRRDLKSAVRRICDLVGRDPEHIRAEVIALRGALRNMSAAQHGLSAKTIANIKANSLAALRLWRAQHLEGTSRTPLPPAATVLRVVRLRSHRQPIGCLPGVRRPGRLVEAISHACRSPSFSLDTMSEIGVPSVSMRMISLSKKNDSSRISRASSISPNATAVRFGATRLE